MSDAVWIIKETLAKHRALEELHSPEVVYNDRGVKGTTCKECLARYPCTTIKILRKSTL